MEAIYAAGRIRKHPSLYFPDGDIVISASSKDKTYIEFYKVDRVFLVRHSPVFKDMVSLGEPASSRNEQHDGTAKVHLPDDADDVGPFLAAMYNTATLPLKAGCRDTPRQVQGVMRLAVKYDVEAIRTAVVRHIETEWPHDLEQWDRRQIEHMALLDEASVSLRHQRLPDPAHAIRFVMEFNCPAVILPAAFYELAIDQTRRSSWDFLHRDDFARVTKGMHELAKAWGTTVRDYADDVMDECNNYDVLSDKTDESSGCSRTFAKCVIYTMGEGHVPTDPLNSLHRLHEARNRYLGEWCCNEDVSEKIAEWIRDSATSIWGALPDYFDIRGIMSEES